MKGLYLVVKKSEYNNWYVEADNKAITDFDVALNLCQSLNALSEAKESNVRYFVVEIPNLKTENLEVAK